MNDGINLLINQQQGQQQSKSAPLVRNLALVLLLVVLAASAGVFALTLASPLHNLQQQESNLTTSLQQYNSKIQQLTVIHDRIQNINRILQNRKYFDKIISALKDKVPSTAFLDTFVTDNKKITATIHSTNLDDMNVFLNNLQLLNQDKKMFSSMALTTLSFTNTNNQYSLTVDLGML